MEYSLENVIVYLLRLPFSKHLVIKKTSEKIRKEPSYSYSVMINNFGPTSNTVTARG